MSSQPLIRRVASGVAWTYAAHLVGRLVVFGGLAVSAHVLSPRDFGLFGMAMTVVSFLEVIRGFGLQRALIYFAEHDQDDAVFNTGFVLTILSGLLLGGLLVLSAPAVADYFGVDEVGHYLYALAAYFVIGALGIVPDAVLRHRLDFSRRFWPETSAPLIRYAVAIGCALLGYGPWSLVAGQIAGMVVSVAVTFMMATWRPNLRFDPRAARQLLGYGWQMSVVDLLAAVTLNADYLFVGRFLGGDALGLYSLAFRLPDTTIVAVAYAVSQLLLPTYVKLGGAVETMRRGLVETTRYLGLALIPAATGVTVLAPVLVPVLFGAQWSESVPVVQLLALSALGRALVFAPGAIFAASGRPSYAVASEIVSTVVSVPLFYLAAQRNIGSVAAVQLISVIAYGLVKLTLVNRILALGWYQMMRPLAPALVASLVMAGALSVLLHLTADAPMPMVALGGVLVGAAIYGLAIWQLDVSALRQVRELMRGSGHRSQAVGAQ